MIQSVERAAAIVKLLAGGPDGMGVSDIARALSLPKGTTHGILRTLQHVGFVDQDISSGRYLPGKALRRLGGERLDVNELRSRCINWADPLAAHSGSAVRIGVLRDCEVLVVHHVFSPYDTQETLDVGCRLPAHATALGKVLLAYDTLTTETLLARDRAAFTRRTLVGPHVLRRALSAIRAAGWGAQIEECVPGKAAVAAPIRAYGGLVVGAIGVAGEVEEICDTHGSPKATLVTRVRHTARSISRDLL